MRHASTGAVRKPVDRGPDPAGKPHGQAGGERFAPGVRRKGRKPVLRSLIDAVVRIMRLRVALAGLPARHIADCAQRPSGFV